MALHPCLGVLQHSFMVLCSALPHVTPPPQGFGIEGLGSAAVGSLEHEAVTSIPLKPGGTHLKVRGRPQAAG